MNYQIVFQTAGYFNIISPCAADWRTRKCECFEVFEDPNQNRMRVRFSIIVFGRRNWKRKMSLPCNIHDIRPKILYWWVYFEKQNRIQFKLFQQVTWRAGWRLRSSRWGCCPYKVPSCSINEICINDHCWLKADMSLERKSGIGLCILNVVVVFFNILCGFIYQRIFISGCLNHQYQCMPQIFGRTSWFILNRSKPPDRELNHGPNPTVNQFVHKLILSFWIILGRKSVLFIVNYN